jgi:subfamily B ATP-binding cassette protein MsbA
MNWKLAIIAFLVIPFASQILKILGRKMRKSSKESQDIISDISHKFQESLQGIAIVKAFNYEKRAIDKFNQVNQEYFNKIMRYLRATSISGPIMEFLGSIILILLIIIGSHWIFSGEMKPATFFSFIAAFFTAYIPLKNISNLNSKLQMGLASWDRIYQILKEKPAVLEITNPIKIERINGKIEFKNVYYRYPTSKNWILKNISFTINPNEVAAFVGPSGSGKSTIIQLILRFFDPNEGNILIDDIDIKKIDIKSLREFMSIVTQDTILFDDTVKNNISMGKENAQEQEIIEAAKSADAELFIKNMPAGSETIIGERGIKVSGGQRQRLAIARAIIRKPKILLLDEATSNLDTKSEAIVQKAIENVLKDKTVIMSAHRLSTVKNASKIFVLRDGEIIESGDHSTLMQKKGEYRKFFEAQI